MLYHLLSLLDAVAAVFLIGGHFGLWSVPLLYGALYLLAKLIAWRDFFGFIDALAGIYFLFVFFGHASALTWVFACYFLYKLSAWIFGSLAS